MSYYTTTIGSTQAGYTQPIGSLSGGYTPIKKTETEAALEAAYINSTIKTQPNMTEELMLQLAAKIENGSVDLSQSKIEQFAAVFGISPSELMGWGEDTEEPVNFDGLSDKKKALIEFALSVPEDKASMVLRVLKSMVEDD